jgi:hypothetical protein
MTMVREPDLFLEPDFDAKKEELTRQEHRFLELFFFSMEGLTREEAARRAGFRARTKSGLLLAAKRAILKLEVQTDHREIFRKVGLRSRRLKGNPGHDPGQDDPNQRPVERLDCGLEDSMNSAGGRRRGPGSQIIINPTRTMDGTDPVNGQIGAQGQGHHLGNFSSENAMQN